MASDAPAGYCEVSVYYSRPLEEFVDAGKYDFHESVSVLSKFNPRKNGREDVRIELICLGRIAKSGEVFAEISKRKMRPANFYEILAIGEKFPEIQKRFPIVALDSVLIGDNGEKCVPALWGLNGLRGLNVFSMDTEWGANHHFAAVCKDE